MQLLYAVLELPGADGVGEFPLLPIVVPGIITALLVLPPPLSPHFNGDKHYKKYPFSKPIPPSTFLQIRAYVHCIYRRSR